MRSKIKMSLQAKFSKIYECSFTLFVLKSHEHRFNAVLTAFSKKQVTPTYTSQKFQTKTRFYLYFLTCAWACSSARIKIAFRNFKNSLMLIYTFRFFKTKQMRFSSLAYDENKASFRRKQTQKLEKINLEKFKKYCRRLSRKSSHNGVTHYVFLVLYQKRLNGH